jgi:hypothetical protein
MIFEHTFDLTQIRNLKSLAAAVRTSASNPTRNQENTYVKSFHRNAWWRRNESVRSKFQDIYETLIEPLSPRTKNQISSARIMVRKVNNISRNYVGRQALHINVSRNPVEGEAFLQVIYYIDTPKIGNTNVPNEERGQLLLYQPNNRSHPTIFTPRQGKAVYFTPNDTFHEVLAPPRNVNGNVSRNMIILMLYKRPSMNANVNTNEQVRPFGNLASRAIRVIAGHEAPPTRRGNQGATGLENLMARVRLTTRRRRPANNTGNTRTPKRRRIV